MENAIERVTEKLQGWGDTLIGMAPNLVVAILVLLASWLGAKLLRKVTNKVLLRFNVGQAVTGLMSSMVAIVVLSIGFFVALGVLQLDKAVTSLLAGAGVIGLVLGFAFQDSAADVLAGVLLALRKPFMVGDLIHAQESFGRVVEINLRETMLDTPDGKREILPNREVFTSRVTNYTVNRHRRVSVPVGVTYAADLDHVAAVVQEAIESVPMRIKSRDVQVFFTGFGGSSIDLEARFWIPFKYHEADYNAAFSDALRRIKKAFDAEDITIPFPIRTLDFGIEGGKPLDTMLSDVRTADADSGRTPEQPS